MALSDMDSSYYCWYDAASGSLSSTLWISTTANDFGQGKVNTIRMVEAWNNTTYGAQDDGYYTDMWGAIQSYDIVEENESDSQKWFVPSKSEWSAFGDKLGVTRSNYKKYGLYGWCWSSSTYSSNCVYKALVYNAYIYYAYVSEYSCYVRLCATF